MGAHHDYRQTSRFSAHLSLSALLLATVLTGIASLMVAGPLGAAEKKLDIRYLGLHSRQAKVTVNRRSYTRRAGESGKGQVTLISATKHEAILRVDIDVYR